MFFCSFAFVVFVQVIYTIFSDSGFQKIVFFIIAAAYVFILAPFIKLIRQV